MKRFHGIMVVLLVLSFPALGIAEIPDEIAGFKLGGNIAELQDRIKMDTALPLRYSNYIEEVEIQHVEGFKNGLLWLGKCTAPGAYRPNSPEIRRFVEKILRRTSEALSRAIWEADRMARRPVSHRHLLEMVVCG